MVLLSVDKDSSYDVEGAKKKTEEILTRYKLDWDNVFDPDGWAGVERTFNVSGYGLILVDPKGVVRGVDLHASSAEKLLEEIFPK